MRLFFLPIVCIITSISSAQEIDSVWIQKTYIQRFSKDTGTFLAQANLVDINGRQISLSDYKGKIIMLNIWTTWCGPCKVNFEYLPQLDERLRAIKLDSVVQFINVCTEDSRKEWKTLLNKLNPSGINLYSLDTGIYKEWAISGFPTTILLDRSGKVIAKHFIDARTPITTDFLLYEAARGIKPAEAIWVHFRQSRHFEKFLTYTNDEEGRKYSSWKNILMPLFIQHHKLNSVRAN